ncbi:hypothetical protein [Flavisolibacter nicotianae]|uniref:hypothetical protein n=1 Tax=Flavisolibacter nicotianae TaxID=2364882 RepID=UPI0013C42BB0|nr:hypothetical protein [Flavisolibacter nicotianae]
MILTKNSILQKTVALLAGVQEQLSQTDNRLTLATSPKISKGENYRGLPYVVLDYPRIANGENLLFIRSMFWWGHFFSCTLQLAGTYKEANRERLAAAYESLAARDLYIGIHEDPWQHHFEESNYKKIAAVSKAGFLLQLQQQPHIKIAARWPLSQWDAAANLLVDTWLYFADLVS